MSAQLREAASVILLRRAGVGFEVFLLRRHQHASFMASAFVFPGGASEPAEDARTAAARELFEEAGVLLARALAPVAAARLGLPSQAALRRAILDGASAHAALAAAGLGWATEPLIPWAHWITPSAEPRRFSARFFVCELPEGQEPSFDDVETVDQVWVRPGEALARAGELALPPPQVRTCWELAQLATIEEVLAAARTRSDEPHPIMPRLCPPSGGAAGCLLLPWDPDYIERGTGDATPLTYVPRWASGPSRFLREGSTWNHVAAPGSTIAG
jgi:8-oxo-dGTP pyrophosphatase MutT (NUDIX family)